MDDLFGVTELWQKQVDVEHGQRRSSADDNKPTIEIEERMDDRSAQKI